MEKKDIEKRFITVCNQVFSGRIKSAIDELNLMVKNTSQPDYFYQTEILTENYHSLLKYAYEGYEDPKRTEILNGISASILNMADEIKHTIADRMFLYHKGEKKLLSVDFGDDSESVISHVDQILFAAEMQKLSSETGAETTTEVSFDRIFRFLWLTDRIDDNLAGKIRTIIHSDVIEWHDKSLVISAITLSLLRYFNPVKFELLSEFFETRQHKVCERALVGLVIALIYYNRRIHYYPEITNTLNNLSQDESIRTDIEAIILQILLAKETEKITTEFEKEVLPDMKKMIPRIEDKLQLGELFEEDDIEGKNPGWKDLIDEVPGLFERIERFTRMQMEGADVFMGTFAMLKNYDFFHKISNWFVPFYPGHPDLTSPPIEKPEEINRLLESLDHAFYICNSDKYSFVLNFMNLPEQQQSMIVSHFESELQQMKEMESEEKILAQESTSGSVFIQYIQDLYRFFKLFPARLEFDDFFQKDFFFGNIYFYQTWFENQKFTEQLAGFYFDHEHYPEAIEIFVYLSTKGTPKAEYFEKIAYAYQKLEQYDEAIAHYKKAELFDCDRLWVLKKLGLCSIKVKNYTNARKYFEDAAAIKPDDLKLQIQIGNCCLNLGDFKDALEHFGKVRYFQPDNMKVLRPVAYCNFILGILKEASAFYNEILASDSPSPYDYMNAGHVQLCSGNRKSALDLYKMSFLDKSLLPEMFIVAFQEDAVYLEKNGVHKEELPLILDFLLFQNL